MWRLKGLLGRSAEADPVQDRPKREIGPPEIIGGVLDTYRVPAGVGAGTSAEV